jgi:hypothetical protein
VSTSNDGLNLRLPDDFLTNVVDLVTERIRDELAHDRPVLTRSEAAAFLGVPVSRLEKDRTVPCRRWDGRVLYLRDELEEWVRGLEQPAA